MSKDFYTTQEIAKLLGISRVAIFYKIKNGQIKAEKIGRNYAIPKSELPIILNESLSKEQKDVLSRGVERTVEEYGETLKKLGKE